MNLLPAPSGVTFQSDPQTISWGESNIMLELTFELLSKAEEVPAKQLNSCFKYFVEDQYKNHITAMLFSSPSSYVSHK